MNKNTLVLYHDNCLDGLGSAAIAYSKLGDDADYIPVQYSQYNKLQEQLKDTKYVAIYMLDFCFTHKEMIDLLNYCAHMYIFDHHEGAKGTLKLLENYSENIHTRYHVDKSGVGITWDYFYPEDELMPILAHIQDRDLWRFELDETKEICEALYSRLIIPWDIKAWAKIIMWSLESYGYFELKQAGDILVKHKQQRVDSIIASEICEDTADYIIVNAPSDIASELGNAIANKFSKPALIWSYNSVLGKHIFSVRSNDSCSITALEIAKNNGGGGHKHAAGFTTAYIPFYR